MDPSATGLPLVPYLPRIDEALDRRRLCVLTAEPGAGKSTLVPAWLLDRPWLASRKIRMLEPRRLAAAAVAARISELLGEPLGRRAGYRVRSSSRVGPETRLEVVTEALLARAHETDPLLGDTGLVILDEFHERSIHADFALALLLETRRARPDLAVLLMSATIDAARVAAFVADGDPAGPAPVVECPGRRFPVETTWRPLAAAHRWEDAFADLVAAALPETGGDLLAFLPGVREIERVTRRLADCTTAEVVALHGSLPLERQQAVLRPRPPGAPPRAVVATSLAESSLTVPGVRTVVDAGWARTAELHHATGLERLVTVRVSAASADQRRGRAGREGPGRCIRAWRETEPLPPHPQPEILRADLSGLVLECALWGARDAAGLRWLDVPPTASWSTAAELDRMLGLLDADGRPTPRGRDAVRLGLAPRLAVLVLEARDGGDARAAAEVAAILEERDGSGVGRDPDLVERIARLRAGGGSTGWRRAVIDEARRILVRAGAPHAGASPADTGSGVDADALGRCLGRAFPDRIARREPDGTYRFVTGRVARWPDERRGPAWVVAPDADAGETTGMIRLAVEINDAEAGRLLTPLATEDVVVRWNGLAPRCARTRSAGRLVLSERAARPAEASEAVIVALLDRLRREGIGILPWDERSRGLLARLRFHAARTGGPALDDRELARRAPEWLLPRLVLAGGPVIDDDGLAAALGALVPGRRADFERVVPGHLVLPTGTRCRIDYAGGAPVVEARIQEVFGMKAGPVICGVPLVFRLLSPARRPVQVTDDLAGFWRTSYTEVRKEMRGRYPKHPWPEDPAAAAPTRKASSRRSPG